MAPVTTELKVLVKVAGDKGLDKLSRSLTNIGKQAQVSSVKFDQVAKKLQQVQQNSNNSIASLRNYRNAWRDIAEQVEIGSKEFRKATEEARKLDAQIQKAQGRRQGGAGGRFRAGAQIAGTVAAAGVFGGPEGILGAGVGALFGGPAGAAVGGAIGAQVGGLRQQLGGIAEYSAELAKLRIALQGVTTNQTEYKIALNAITQATQDFAIPQSLVTRQFTRLQASVQGAGGNIRDTEVAFKGIVAAVRATGGSLADVDAALTATAQVFSKGKVSAEELRQQIGERLPGAFTLFAESIGLTPQELDKALEKGQVSLQDFQKFAESLFERYGETAQEIADGPASAGDRLKVALENLQEAIGPTLAEIGRKFQEFAIFVIEKLTPVANLINKLTGQDLAGKAARLAALEQTILPRAEIQARRFLVSEGTSMQLAMDYQNYLQGLRDERDRLRKELNRGQAEGVQDIPESRLGGITPDAGKTKRDTAAERALRAYNKALEDAAKLATDLTRKTRDVQLQLTGVGISAKEAIEIKYQQAFNKAADIAEDLGRKVADLQAATGLAFEGLTQKANEYLKALEDVAVAQRDAALFALRLSELGMSPEGFQSMEAAFAGGAGGMGFGEGMQASLLQQQSDAIDQLIEKYPQLSQAAQAAADVISFGFRDIIFGVKSAQQVFSEFLKNIADMLFETAKQMIAQYIALAIARMFAFGGSGGGLSGGLGGLPATSNVPFIGSMPFTGFADGGTVMPGNTYMVGERGPELLQLNPNGSGQVINNNQLSSAMNRYRRSGTTSTNESAAMMQGGEGGTAVLDKPIDVRYTVDRINNVDYVTAAQFQAGMQQAAQQGAQRGEQQTLKRLQMSSSTRKRLGI